MKTKIFWRNYLLLTCFVLFLFSCGKEKQPEPDLVPITMTGANTMGFYVDGVPHNSKGLSTWSGPGVRSTILEGNILHVFGDWDNPRFTFFLDRKLDLGHPVNTYFLDGSIWTENRTEYTDDSLLGGKIYEIDSLHIGEIKILKLDKDFVSGTFYFDAINPATGKVIHVTDGRFDIQLQ